MDKAVIQAIINDYVTNELTAKACGKKYGYGKTTILKILNVNQIEKRSTYSYFKKEFHPLLADKNWCIKKYINEKWSITKIALVLNVGASLVTAYFNDHEIKRFGSETDRYRKSSDLSKELLSSYLFIDNLTPHEIAKNLGFTHKVITRLIDKYQISYENYAQKGLIQISKENLIDLYIHKNLSTTIIGQMLGCDKAIVIRRLRKFDIPIKPSRSYLKSTSMLEKEIREMLMSWPYKMENNHRGFGQEIDIYFPSIKFGVEVNGEYWHSELFKDCNHHINKFLYYYGLGITLFTIWESDWLYRKEWVLEKLRNVVNRVHSQKIEYDLDYEPHEYQCGMRVDHNSYMISDVIKKYRGSPIKVYRTGIAKL